MISSADAGVVCAVGPLHHFQTLRFAERLFAPTMSPLLENKSTADPLKAPTSHGRIAELDGVRAIAITMVIGAHYPVFGSMVSWL